MLDLEKICLIYLYLIEKRKEKLLPFFNKSLVNFILIELCAECDLKKNIFFK